MLGIYLYLKFAI